MAMIYCSHCANEYDDALPTCPYCGNLTVKKSRGALKRIIKLAVLVAIIYIGVSLLDENSRVAQIFTDLKQEVIEFIEPKRSANRDRTPQPVSRILTTDSMSDLSLEEYLAQANHLLMQEDSSIVLSLEEMSATQNKFSYALDTLTTVNIYISPNSSKLEAIEVVALNAPSFSKRMGNTVAALFAAAIPTHPNANDVKPQIAYLEQLSKLNPEQQVAYPYDDLYLIGHYLPSDKMIRLTITSNTP